MPALGLIFVQFVKNKYISNIKADKKEMYEKRYRFFEKSKRTGS